MKNSSRKPRADHSNKVSRLVPRGNAHSSLVGIYAPIADGIAKLFFPHAEVVLHDLSTLTIAHIANALSKRAVGDASLLDGELEEICAQSVYGPYEKASVTGGQLKSITIVLRKDRQAVGLLCINLDLTIFETAGRAIAELLKVGPSFAAEPLLARDWREVVNFEIREFLISKSKTLNALTKDERIELVGRFEALDLFNVRGAADRIASQLQMSRASLYRLLVEAKRRDKG